jgi:uncharacterized protein YheU (UPF0270 family)
VLIVAIYMRRGTAYGETSKPLERIDESSFKGTLLGKDVLMMERLVRRG